MPCQEVSCLCHLGHKGVDQGGLADAGFPGDDSNLPLALARLHPPLLQMGQFGLASDKEPRLATGDWRGLVQHLRRFVSPAGRRHCHRGDKPISPPIHRLDKLRALGPIPEGSAQLPNRYGYDRVTHRRLGPHSSEEGVFRQQLAGLGYQRAEDGQGFGIQVNDLRPLPQALVAQIESERSEDKALGLLHAFPFPPHSDVGDQAYRGR
jgi:hypothetical protein